MSKRLQVMLPDDEYRLLLRAARRRGKPVSQLVRDGLRRELERDGDMDPDQRIAAILRFARFAGPTGDIDQLLEQIEQGRGLT